jgi:hypothetical protein
MLPIANSITGANFSAEGAPRALSRRHRLTGQPRCAPNRLEQPKLILVSQDAIPAEERRQLHDFTPLTTFEKNISNRYALSVQCSRQGQQPDSAPVSVLIACTTGKLAPECPWPHRAGLQHQLVVCRFARLRARGCSRCKGTNDQDHRPHADGASPHCWPPLNVLLFIPFANRHHEIQIGSVWKMRDVGHSI